MFGFFC